MAASIGIAIPGLLVEMLSARVEGKPPEALVFSAPNGGYLRNRNWRTRSGLTKR